MISIQHLFVICLGFISNPTDPKKDDFKGTYVSYTEALPFQFEKRITVSCDSSIKTIFKGGRTYEVMTGKWKFHADTLTIFLNPVLDKTGQPTYPHWKAEMKFHLHKNLLIPIISPADMASRHRRKYTFAKVKVQKC